MFHIWFSVSFTMPDGTILTAEDEEDLEEKMKAFMNLTKAERKTSRCLPVDLMFEDGSHLQ